MYRSLLHQLLSLHTETQAVLDTLPPTATVNLTGPYQWSIEKLKDLFIRAIQHPTTAGKSVVCFVGALDEYDEDEIRDMVHFFELINQQFPYFRVFFSSRHYHYITVNPDCTLEMILEHLPGHGEDISSYLKCELRIGLGSGANGLREMARAKSSGIFLCVILVVRILNKEYDRGSRLTCLKKKLQELPSDLSQLFHDMLTKNDRDKDTMLLCIQ
jgi:hypothetical protein